MCNNFKVKLILAWSLVAAGCDPYQTFAPDIHPVTTVLQVSPQSDTIKIGDTLWLSCHIPLAYQEGTQRKTLGTDNQVLFSIVHPSWYTICTSAVTFEGSFKSVLQQSSFHSYSRIYRLKNGIIMSSCFPMAILLTAIIRKSEIWMGSLCGKNGCP